MDVRFARHGRWIVQQTYRRWYTLDDDERSGIVLPKAWLTRTAAEISLELLDTDRAPVSTSAPAVSPAHLPRPNTSDPATLATHDRVARRFAAACVTADVADLTALRAADAVVVCDGGGKVRAPVRPIRGATEVARFVASLLAGRDGDVLAVEPVNGRAGLTLRRAGRAAAVVSVSIAGDEITAVWVVLNPDKLHGWHRH